MSTRAPFSIIVPTLNEADEIGTTLARARSAFGERAELIVADGGSTDDTLSIAREAADVLDCPPGRGPQLRCGADRASGHIFVFLHADTWPDDDSGGAIAAAVAGGVSAGCLTIEFRGAPGLRYRILASAINLRTRVFRTATGDQVIFATDHAYRAAGGFEAIPLFEDVRLVARLRRTGRFRRVDATAFTSPRRWERQGFSRTVWRHLWMRTLHALGADPARLALRYR